MNLYVNLFTNTMFASVYAALHIYIHYKNSINFFKILCFFVQLIFLSEENMFTSCYRKVPRLGP